MNPGWLAPAVTRRLQSSRNGDKMRTSSSYQELGVRVFAAHELYLAGCPGILIATWVYRWLTFHATEIMPSAIDASLLFWKFLALLIRLLWRDYWGGPWFLFAASTKGCCCMPLLSTAPVNRRSALTRTFRSWLSISWAPTPSPQNKNHHLQL